jgi:hypothetical protein
MLNQVGEELGKQQCTASRGDKARSASEVMETAVSNEVMGVLQRMAARACE